MNIKHCLFAAIAVLSLAACQRESEAPVTPAVEPAPAPVATPAPAATASVPVTEQAAMDYAYRCRMSDGAWSDAGAKCEMTSALCPTFGTWVDGSGCKSDVVEAECKNEGQQFVDDKCLIRYIPASAMRESDFKKG